MAFATEIHQCIHCSEVGTTRVNDAQYRKAGFFRRILWCLSCGLRTEHTTYDDGSVSERFHEPQTNQTAHMCQNLLILPLEGR